MLPIALAFTALTGAATAAEQSKKSKVHGSLLRQVKTNPAIVKNKKFIRKATAAAFELPITIRFNRCLADAGRSGTCSTFEAANDTIDFDLGRTLSNIGNQTITIETGVLNLWATFGDPRVGGKPGDLSVSNESLNGTPRITTLTLSGVDVLANTDIMDADGAGPLDTGGSVSFVMNTTTGAEGQSQVPGTNGCSDIGSSSLEYGVTAQEAGYLAGLSPGNGQLWSDYTAAYGSLDNFGAAGETNIPSSITDDIVFRTAPILARVHSVRGDANLFTGNVDVTINTTVTVNSVFRELDNESPLHCAQVITGASESTDVSVRARDSNGLSVDPAITIDDKLRLAVVGLGRGPISRPEIKACLSPIRPFGVQVTELTGQAIDLLSTYAAINTSTLVGVDDLDSVTAISAAAGSYGASATTADFRLLNGAEPNVTCGIAPVPIYNDGLANQFNILADRLFPMAADANHVEIRPDVSIQKITAEGLVGHYAE